MFLTSISFSYHGVSLDQFSNHRIHHKPVTMLIFPSRHTIVFDPRSSWIEPEAPRLFAPSPRRRSFHPVHPKHDYFHIDGGQARIRICDPVFAQHHDEISHVTGTCTGRFGGTYTEVGYCDVIELPLLTSSTSSNSALKPNKQEQRSNHYFTALGKSTASYSAVLWHL
jgi:hypothetical protein